MLKENALTTIGRAKHFLYGDEPTEDDDNIAFAINAASSAIEHYCRRKFGIQTYIQNELDRTDEVLFNEYPVRKVIGINGKKLDDYRFATYLDSESGILNVYGAEFKGVVEYEAGYVLPKDATDERPSDLPSDLELATLRLVNEMYVDSDGFTEDVGSIKLGDWTVRDGITSQSDIESVIPPSVQQLINSHARRWSIV